MAKQSQFQKSARSPGFQPIQVSGKEIANMRAESARIANAMRDARNADINERERQQRARLQNQQLEASERQRNLQVLTQNAATERQQLQLESQQKLKQLEANQKASAEIFKSVADFSKTALGQLQKMDETRFEEERLRAYELARAGQYEDVIKQIQGEAELQATEEERRALIDEGEQTGAIDSLTASQLKSMSSGTRLGLEQGRGVYMLTNVYQDKLQKALAENPGLGSEETSVFLTKFYRDFLRDETNAVNGKPLINLKPELLRVGTEFVQRLHQGIQTAANKRETTDLRDQRVDDAKTILHQNPRQFKDNIVQSFRTFVSDLGRPKAHEEYAKFATARDAKGNFRFDMEQLAQPVLKAGSTKTYAEEWPDRFAQMQIARNKAEQEQAKADDTAEKLAYKEAEGKTLSWFVSGNNTKEEVDTAVQMFIDTYGKVPQSILTYQKNYTLEARAKAKQIEAIESIPFGFIRQVDVDAMSALDANKGRELDKRYAEQERRYGKGTFAEINKGFKKTAFGTTKLGTVQTGDANGILVLTAMQGEYRRRVDERMAAAGDNSDATFNKIAQQVGIELENEVKTGLLAKGNKWYREVNAKGQIKFPGLNTGTVPTAKQAEDNLKGIKDRIAENGGGEGGLERTLDTAGAIITAQEAADILRNYNKPGFVIPRDVMFVSRLGNGTDPFTIINRQLKALNLIELVPPQISQDVESTFTPQEKRDLYDMIGGPKQKLRQVQKVAARTTGDTSAFRDPSKMRFNIVQYVSNDPAIAGTADGVSVVYDPHGHGGADMHGHYELSSVAERQRMQKFLENTIDPFTGQPYRITSVIREGDPGAHGAGTALDIAPPVTLPVDQERAWYAELNKRLGYNP